MKQKNYLLILLMSLAILCPNVIRAGLSSNVSSELNIANSKAIKSTIRNADSQEQWSYIGDGVWTDPFWQWSDGNPVTTTIAVEKNFSNPGVYRVNPFGEWVNIHIKETNKVYIDDYSNINVNEIEIILSQICSENGWNQSYYGTITEETIIIPSEYFNYYTDENGWNSVPEGRECKIILPEGFDNPIIHDNGVFMGLVAFGEQLKQKPISLLNETSKSEFTSFVNNLEMSNVTLLYYAVDTAIDNLLAQRYPENLSNVVLITFTDGLDQGSLSEHPEYRTDQGYASYLSERITNTSVQGHSLQAYAIGLKGEDVVNDELFMYNLSSLASSPENAISVENIEGLQEQLARIYDNLNQQLTQRIISIAVPMMSHGSKYRFTLDGASENPEESNLWFEGVFNIDNLTLENVTYNGFTSASGSTITATKDGIYLIYSLDDCKEENGDILSVEKNDIDQWTYVESHNVWQHNIENDKDGKIQIDDIKSSAAILFALDCSTSLGDLFPIVKKTANSFIRKLAGEVEIDPIVAFNPTSIDPANNSELEKLTKIILSFDKSYFENGLKIADGATIEILNTESNLYDTAEIKANRYNSSYPDVYRTTITLSKILTEDGTYFITIPKGTIIEYDDRFSSPEITLNYTIKNGENSIDILSFNNQKLTIYNIAGTIVLKNATTDDLKNLSSGVYIINGKKIFIK